MQVATETVKPLFNKSAANPTPRLHPSHFFSAETRRNVWSVVPVFGTDYKSLLMPTYWSNVARRLRPGDLIEVTAEDGSYFAQLFVLAAEDKAAAVAQLSYTELHTVEMPDAADGFEVRWGGPIVKWCAVRMKDHQRVIEKMDTKAAANDALTKYLQALSR